MAKKATGKGKVVPPERLDGSAIAMRRSKCDKSFFVVFDYSDDVLHEIDRYFKADHAVIIPLTVKEILGKQIARKLA